MTGFKCVARMVEVVGRKPEKLNIQAGVVREREKARLGETSVSG